MASNNSKNIFLLSHMRANTSVIGHILGSHAQISGYYEMHLSYQKPADLQKQKQLFAAKDDIKKSSVYMFDKLLHDDYNLNLTQLKQEEIKVLVSIRNPEQSLKSIVNLFTSKEGNYPYAQVEEALAYLVKRLETLAEFCQINRQYYYYFDADLIRLKPDSILQVLTKWLGLYAPLTQSYDSFSQTGKTSAGDSSKHIYHGKIISGQTDYSQIDINSDDIWQLQQSYKQCRSIMLSNARDVMSLD